MAKNSFLKGLGRGFRLRCPNCGEGALFNRYLKVRPVCTTCSNDNSRYPADDAPPYFTILIVGHLVVAPMLLFPIIWEAPAWAVLAVLMPLLAAVTLWLLPRVKGAVIGAQWAMGIQREPVEQP